MQLRSRIAVSGEPGAGKTTLLAALLAAAPASHCVRACEEIRELAVPITHGSYYEVRPPALDGTGEITLRDLVKFVLAMRPDRIVVGEVRGAEAFELSRAVNAGCGFLCTVHANSASEALDALVNAALMAGENVTERIVRKVFSESLDVVVHLDRDDTTSGDADGIRRHVIEIAAVVPALRDDFTVEPLFVRDQPRAPAPVDRRAAAVAGGAPRSGERCRGARRDRGAWGARRDPRRRPGGRCVLRVARGTPRRPAGRAAELDAGRHRRLDAPALWLAQAGVPRLAHAVRARIARGRRRRVRRHLLRDRHRAGRPRARGRGGAAPARLLRPPARRAAARAAGGVARRPARHRARRSRPAARSGTRSSRWPRPGRQPLRDAFARFPTLARMLGPVAALEIVKEELADPTSDRVIEVLILAQERGGPIVARILEDLVVATTKDLKVLDEVESEGLEMKLNARAVLVMPWLVLVALTIRAGAFRDFYPSPAGLVVVLVGAALCAVGAWWIGRLGRVARGAARVRQRATRSRCRHDRRGGGHRHGQRGRGRGRRRSRAGAAHSTARAARPALHDRGPRPIRARRGCRRPGRGDALLERGPSVRSTGPRVRCSDWAACSNAAPMPRSTCRCGRRASSTSRPTTTARAWRCRPSRSAPAGAGFGALVFHRPLAAVGLARVRRGVRRVAACGVGSSAASPIAASGSGSSCTP